jgi:hypothetical protein
MNDHKQNRDVNKLLDAALDVGSAWAEYGLDYGKFALENSAKALVRTARAIETLQQQLAEKKAGAQQPDKKDDPAA